MAIVLHSILVFLLVVVVIRVVGKRELSQLSAFDFVILIVMGDLVAEGVISEDTSATGAIVAVATFTVLTVFISWISWKFPRARSVLEGLPTVLIRDGHIVHDALTVERVNLEDLREAARQHGHRDLDDLQWAILEQDGTFSFFERAGDEPQREDSGQ